MIRYIGCNDGETYTDFQLTNPETFIYGYTMQQNASVSQRYMLLTDDKATMPSVNIN